MGTRRQHHARKKPLSGGVKRPDAFWGLIVLSAHLRKGKSDPITRAQPAHPYISFTEQFRRSEPVESDNHADDGRLSEGKASASNPASQKGENDEESSGGSDDMEGLNEDGEHDEDDSGAAFDASGHTTPKPQPSHGTPPGAIARIRESLRKSKDPSRRTTPERKTAPSEPASASSKRPRKRNRMAVENSEENCDEDEDEGEVLNVPRDLNRSTETHAQRQQMPTVTILAPLSSHHQLWTREEDEALFSLRNEGKNWEHIGERVLGRTAKGVKKRWEYLRTDSLKAVKMRTKEGPQQQISPVVLAMAKIPCKKKTWSREEDGMLISLRTKGRNFEYISKRMSGRGHGACKRRWNKTKNKYSQAITASKDPESDREEDPSDCEDAGSLAVSSLEQQVKGANSKPRSANLESEDPNSNTTGDSTIDYDLDIPPAERPYAAAVRVHGAFVSAVAGKRPKLKATSIDHHNQKVANSVTGGEYSSPGTNDSTPSDQADLQSVIASREPKTKKDSSFQKDSLLGECISVRNKGGTQELETHRRSNSWPQ